MKYYIVENGFNIEIFENKEQAKKDYAIIFDRLTDSEKEKVEYLRLYEVETENREQLEKIADFTDIITEMLECYK